MFSVALKSYYDSYNLDSHANYLLQLGDPERKAASSAAYLLTCLLAAHPNMKVYDVGILFLTRIVAFLIKIVDYVKFCTQKVLHKIHVPFGLIELFQFADGCDR